ncbi:hypothetical protein DIPPA_58673 [Diplonema papillatum]|nr:hypothetical protein DIPPA_58673 [Diplonema papillatum]
MQDVVPAISGQSSGIHLAPLVALQYTRMNKCSINKSSPLYRNAAPSPCQVYSSCSTPSTVFGTWAGYRPRKLIKPMLSPLLDDAPCGDMEMSDTNSSRPFTYDFWDFERLMRRREEARSSALTKADVSFHDGHGQGTLGLGRLCKKIEKETKREQLISWNVEKTAFLEHLESIRAEEQRQSKLSPSEMYRRAKQAEKQKAAAYTEKQEAYIAALHRQQRDEEAQYRQNLAHEIRERHGRVAHIRELNRMCRENFKTSRAYGLEHLINGRHAEVEGGRVGALLRAAEDEQARIDKIGRIKVRRMKAKENFTVSRRRELAGGRDMARSLRHQARQREEHRREDTKWQLMRLHDEVLAARANDKATKTQLVDDTHHLKHLRATSAKKLREEDLHEWKEKQKRLLRERKLLAAQARIQRKRSPSPHTPGPIGA